jgi:hypothetical protein
MTEPRRRRGNRPLAAATVVIGVVDPGVLDDG